MRGDNLKLDDAILLAQAINAMEHWYVLSIERASGERLEENLWAVSAVCMLHPKEFHYWRSRIGVSDWVSWAKVYEAAMREKYSEKGRD